MLRFTILHQPTQMRSRIKALLNIIVLILFVRYLASLFFENYTIPVFGLRIPSHQWAQARELMMGFFLRGIIDVHTALSLIRKGFNYLKEPSTLAIFIPSLVALAIKVYLVNDFKVRRIPEAGFDDFLFIGLADSIVSGNWLGGYHYLTLVKGPIYPIFLAINSMLGIPLLLFQNLLFWGALLAISLLLKRAGMSLVFIIPTFFIAFFLPTTHAIPNLRTTRDFFYTSIILWTLASLIFVSLKARKCFRKSLWYGGAVGLLVFALWFTREEAILFLPTLCIAGVYNLKIGNWRLLAAGFMTFLIALSALKAMNYTRYGTWEVIDSTSGSFKHAYHRILSVEEGANKPAELITRTTRLALYEVSPTFRSLMPILDPPGSNNRISGSHFMWKMRQAANSLGFYKNPETSSRFYQSIVDEINLACDQGRLSCAKYSLNGIPLKPSWVMPLWRKVTEGFNYLGSSYEFSLSPELTYHFPSRLSGRLDTYQEITHQVFTEKEREAERAYALYPNRFYIKGEVSNIGNDFSIQIKSGSKSKFIHFLDSRYDPKTFTVFGSCLNDCSMTIGKGRESIVNFSLGKLRLEEGKFLGVGENGALVRVWKEKYNDKIVLPNDSSISTKIYHIERLQSFYQIIMKWILRGGLACLPLVIVAFFWKKLANSTLLLMTLVLMLFSAASRMVGLGVVDLFFFGAINHLYYLPIYPLAVFASMISIYIFLSLIISPAKNFLKRLSYV